VVQNLSQKDRLSLKEAVPQPSTKVPLSQLIPMADADLIDLLEKIFILDPDQRITASEAMAHKWFANLQQTFPPEVSVIIFCSNRCSLW
jgi:serine/threonine protein kinase